METRGRLEPLQPPGWPRPSGYANGVRVPAGWDLLLVAGQVGWDTSQRIVGPDFVQQFEQALRNCLAVVECAGGGPANIVRMTVFCTSKEAYLSRLQELGAAWQRVLGRHYPAMSLVQVVALVEEGAQVEIEATAALPPPDPREEA